MTKVIYQAAFVSTLAVCCLGSVHSGHHDSGNMLPQRQRNALDLESGLRDEPIQPAVIGKVMPVFFERASKVVIQLVRDNLSKAKLGDLETYADGGTPHTLTGNLKHICSVPSSLEVGLMAIAERFLCSFIPLCVLLSCVTHHCLCDLVLSGRSMTQSQCNIMCWQGWVLSTSKADCLMCCITYMQSQYLALSMSP